MASKKVLFICLIVIFVMAVILSMLIPHLRSEYFKNIGKDEMIEEIKTTNDIERKANLINILLFDGLITERQANEFYK